MKKVNHIEKEMKGVYLEHVELDEITKIIVNE